jgi:hypothetical protein
VVVNKRCFALQICYSKAKKESAALKRTGVEKVETAYEYFLRDVEKGLDNIFYLEI